MSKHKHKTLKKTKKTHAKPTPRKPQNRKNLLLALVLLTAAVLLVHWPALSARALSFDDDQYLTENHLVKNPSLDSAKTFLTEILEPSTVAGYYQPLTMISLMTDYALAGSTENLTQFHRTSLALHIANTLLIAVLLYLLFRRPWLAAAVAMLFGLHPMTVETIPWIGERKTLLAAFFALISIICYVLYAQKPFRKYYFASLAAYLFALMSKPTSLPLPALLLLLDYWPLRRLNRRAVTEKIPFFALAALAAVVTCISQNRTCGTVAPAQYGYYKIPLIISHNIVFYLYKIIWPANLSSHYPFPEPVNLSNPAIVAGVVGSVIIITALIISLRWTPAPVTGWLFFFIAILPTMQIVAFSDVIASDKFAYLPAVGLLISLTALAAWLLPYNKYNRKTEFAAACIFLSLAAAETFATRKQLSHWRDTTSLCTHMLKLTPDAAPVHTMLAVNLARKGQNRRAIHHYRRAIETRPDFYEAHNNLADLLAKINRTKLALKHFRRAIQINPQFAQAHNNLAQVLKSQGKLELALSHYRKAHQLKPQCPYINYNLANTLLAKNHLDDSIKHFRLALRRKPHFPQAHYNLATTLTLAGRPSQALQHFKKAHAQKPDWPSPLAGIASILATHHDPKIRNPAQAVKFAEKAAILTRCQNAPILQTLAAAYQSAGNLQQAASTTEKALKIATAQKDHQLINQLQKQLNEYKN